MRICIDPGHGMSNRKRGVPDSGAAVTVGGKKITEAEIVMVISLHCNAANGQANGTETYYRGAKNKSLARACNDAVVTALGTRDRGVKTEEASQHARLAVLNFPRAVLIELGFIAHAGDRAAMLDEGKMLLACQALADVITA